MQRSNPYFRVLSKEALRSGTSPKVRTPELLEKRLLLQPTFDNLHFRYPKPFWVSIQAVSDEVFHALAVGDWVEIVDSSPLKNGGAVELRTSTKNSSDGQLGFLSLMQKKVKGVRMRGLVEQATRDFFHSEDYLEVRTPLLVRSPGMEPHIRPFQTNGQAFLPTSPEFAMKKLLAGGHHRLFQICPAFRFEPHSPQHLQEFTMLEWYRSGFDELQLMEETEHFISKIAQKIFGTDQIAFADQALSLKPPWKRFTVRELFHEHIGIDLHQFKSKESLAKVCETHLGSTASELKTWDDFYFLLWLNCIEPKLPKHEPFFLTEFPASQAALARKTVSPDGYAYARRFEVFIGGFELANAFYELTDPVEQRRRFEEDMNLRAATYGSQFQKNPIDEEFLKALEEGIAPTAGIALGLDRLIMLFANEDNIENTFWLTPLESTVSPPNGT